MNAHIRWAVMVKDIQWIKTEGYVNNHLIEEQDVWPCISVEGPQSGTSLY